MKRIAYVCTDRGVPVFGRKGPSIHVQEVVRHLRAAGAAVEMFVRRIGGDAPAGLEDVVVHRLPKTAKGEVVVRERAALDANAALAETLAKAGPFDLVYERHALWGYAGMEHARAVGVPGLLEVNAPLLVEQRRYRELVLEAEAEDAVARSFAAASALLAVSDGVAAYLEAREQTAPVHVVPNGVDPGRFSPNVTPGIPATGAFTIGFVGTLKPWHGVEDLVEILPELRAAGRDARLLVVGDGPERERLLALAAKLGVREHVILTGAVPPDLIPAYLAAMDVAVAPYPPADDFYFSPLKIFEYMAASRAVVAAAIGQIPDVVVDGVNGLLYPSGDRTALVAALSRLESDLDLRVGLGAEARRTVVRDHTWRSVADRILSLAETCTLHRPPLERVR